MAKKLDFFISYTGADSGWAEWIAWALEEASYTARLQAWDFPAGSNFVEEMQRASAEADRTIAVLSPDYLNSQFARSEWEAAFSSDPTGAARKLVPVRVREVDLKGLYKGIVYIDLVDKSDQEAKQELLRRIKRGRAKPASPPPFPGRSAAETAHSNTAPQTPTNEGSTASRGYMPKIRKRFTDRDRRQFIRQVLDGVREHFRNSMEELRAAHAEIEADLDEIHATKFIAEVFVDGESRGRCKIWLGSSSGDSICFISGHFGIDDDSSLNDQISIETDGHEIFLRPLLGSMHGVDDRSRMGPDDVAAYLWRRFVEPLEWR